MTGDDSGVFASPAARRSAICWTLTLASLVALVLVGLRVAAPDLTDPAWLRTRLAALGPVAPLAFVALQTVQVIVAPIPGQLLAGVGGYLFGTVAGTVYSMTGVLAGSAVVFGLARRYGRPYVERVLDPEALDRWDGVVKRAGVPGLFVLFLLPTFPDDLLCAVAGCTDIRPGTFLALVLVGRTPSFLAVAYAGGQLSSDSFVPAAAAVGALTLLAALVYVGRDRLPDGRAG